MVGIISTQYTRDIVNWAVKVADEYGVGVQFVISKYLEVTQKDMNCYKSMNYIKKEAIRGIQNENLHGY